MRNKQPTLPGITAPKQYLTVTLRFGPKATETIRNIRTKIQNQMPTIPISDADVIRSLLTTAIRDHAHYNTPDFDTYL